MIDFIKRITNKPTKKQQTLVLYLALIIIGVILGLIFDNVFRIKIKEEYSLVELINVLIALLIAIVIPILLAPAIDARRYLKNILINDIESLLNQLIKMQSLIYKWSESDEILDKKNKREFNMEIRRLDALMLTIYDSLKEHYPDDCANLCDNLKTKTKEYWLGITGGDFMKEEFKVNLSFLNHHDMVFRKLEKEARNGIFLINNLI